MRLCTSSPGDRFIGGSSRGNPDPANPAVPIVGGRVAEDAEVAGQFVSWLKLVGGNERPIFVSDNVAYD